MKANITTCNKYKRKLIFFFSSLLQQATHRAPKSTIHGVVNQFGQFRSQRSVADRVLSSFVNIFRRICSHEERVSCSLDDYQSNNMGIDSTHESRCSEPATSQLNTSGNSIEKAMTDSEDLPILMMLTMTEARQCTNLQAAIRCRWLERNPKRKRLTSVSGQQWPNVCKIKDSNSIEKVKCFDEIAATQVSLTLSHPSKGTQLSDMPQTGLLKIFQKSKNGQTRKSCDRKSADSARDEYSISSFDDEEAAMTLGCQEFLRFISL